MDGRPVSFQSLAEGRHWVARAELDDRTLPLRGRDLPVQSVDRRAVSRLDTALRALTGYV